MSNYSRCYLSTFCKWQIVLWSIFISTIAIAETKVIPLTQIVNLELTKCSHGSGSLILKCTVLEKAELGVVTSRLVYWARQAPASRLVVEGDFMFSDQKLLLSIDGQEYTITDTNQPQSFALPNLGLNLLAADSADVLKVGFVSKFGQAPFTAPAAFKIQIKAIYLVADLSVLQQKMESLQQQKNFLVSLSDALQGNLQLAPAFNLISQVAENLLLDLASPDVQQLFLLKGELSALALSLLGPQGAILSAEEKYLISLVNHAVSNLPDRSVVLDKNGTPVTLISYICELDHLTKNSHPTDCEETKQAIVSLLQKYSPQSQDLMEEELKKLQEDISRIDVELNSLQNLMELAL